MRPTRVYNTCEIDADVRDVAIDGVLACTVCSSGTVRCRGEGYLGRGRLEGPSAEPVSAAVSDASGVSIAANSVIASRIDGSVWSWGSAYEGSIGRPEDTALTPGAIPELTTVRTADSQVGGSCAWNASGEIWCWGRVHFVYAQGEEPQQWGPRRVYTLDDVVEFDGGADFGCVRSSVGRVACWKARRGDNEPPPLTISGVEDAVQLSVGALHACAVLRDHRVVCWGDNAQGQLGDGTTAPSDGAVVVPELRAAEVRAGDAHTCARTLDRTLVCWGDNEYGQLGDGSTDDRRAPTVVAAPN